MIYLSLLRFRRGQRLWSDCEGLCAGDSAPAETPDLTVENVNSALDEVRPYLIADGGNVEVASISDGVVYLRLQVPTSPPCWAVWENHMRCP